jgi:hypothetical protein
MPRVEVVPVYRISLGAGKPIHIWRLGKTLQTLRTNCVQMHDSDTLTLHGEFGEQTSRMTRAQVRSLIDQMARLGYEDKHRAEDLP